MVAYGAFHGKNTKTDGFLWWRLAWVFLERPLHVVWMSICNGVEKLGWPGLASGGFPDILGDFGGGGRGVTSNFLGAARGSPRNRDP